MHSKLIKFEIYELFTKMFLNKTITRNLIEINFKLNF